jgi:predicted NBD/HSP70 family sugar kinase
VDAQEADFALAVDIGGTKIEIACIDRSGQLLTPISKQRVPFGPDGCADARGMIDILAPYAQQSRSQPGRCDGIGLSVCGNIDPDSGEAVLVPNLHWRNLPFGQMVAEALELPVYSATDVRMAALAEALWGGAQGVRNFLWATVGTGYGGYLWLDNELYGGAHGFAGNFGHITLDEINGYPCGCGRKGCVETFVSGPAIARAGQAALDAGRSPALARLAQEDGVTSAMVFQAEAAGDAQAQAIIAQVIRLIAINLGGVVNLLDLEMIVMGGGVTHGSPDFVERVSRRIRDFLMTVEARRDLRVIHESFPNAALFGAAAHVFAEAGVIHLAKG